MRGSGRLFLFPDGFRRGVIFHSFDGAAATTQRYKLATLQ